MLKIVSPSSREVRDREWETEAGLGSKHQVWKSHRDSRQARAKLQAR